MALREINLVPDETRDRRAVTRHVTAWSGLLLVALLIIGALHQGSVRMGLTDGGAQKKLRTTDRKFASLVAETRDIQDELERFALVTTLANHQPRWEILSALSEAMNDGVWLQRLTINSPEDDPLQSDVDMTGFAYSNAELGTFLSRLTAEQMFTDVTLDHSKEQARPRGHAPGEARTMMTEFGMGFTVRRK